MSAVLTAAFSYKESSLHGTISTRTENPEVSTALLMSAPDRVQEMDLTPLSLSKPCEAVEIEAVFNWRKETAVKETEISRVCVSKPDPGSECLASCPSVKRPQRPIRGSLMWLAVPVAFCLW